MCIFRRPAAYLCSFALWEQLPPLPHSKPTRQTSECGIHVVMTWRIWADISHVGGMWVLDGLLLPIWEEYWFIVCGNIRTHPYGTQVGQLLWAKIYGIKLSPGAPWRPSLGWRPEAVPPFASRTYAPGYCNANCFDDVVSICSIAQYMLRKK